MWIAIMLFVKVKSGYVIALQPISLRNCQIRIHNKKVFTRLDLHFSSQHLIVVFINFQEVAWDVDTIYFSHDSHEMCLQDFEHLDHRDLICIISALEHNTYFRWDCKAVFLSLESVNIYKLKFKIILKLFKFYIEQVNKSRPT